MVELGIDWQKHFTLTPGSDALWSIETRTDADREARFVRKMRNQLARSVKAGR